MATGRRLLHDTEIDLNLLLANKFVRRALAGQTVEAIDGRFLRTYHHSEMPYEFIEWEEDPEPQTSSARSGSPPRKHTGIGILDSAGPPKKPLGFIPAIPWSSVIRGFALLILLGLAFGIVALLFAQL